MMKYRGPKDQHPIIERKYFIRLAVGLVIIIVGIIGTVFTQAASQVPVLAPNPADPGAGPIEVQAPISRNPALGFIALLVGVGVNFYAISKYRGEYSEIKEKEPRPQGMFTAIGIVITLLAAALGGYAILII